MTQTLDIWLTTGAIYYAAKRVMDVVIASCLLILLLPLMILVGIAIFCIFARSGILYTGTGRRKTAIADGKHIYWERKTFRCYKFRTMRLNADSSIHQAYMKALIENDERQMQAVQKAATRPAEFCSSGTINRCSKRANPAAETCR